MSQSSVSASNVASVSAPRTRSQLLMEIDRSLQTDPRRIRGLLIVNIRHLRDINVAIGSSATDLLLTAFGNLLADQVRPSDIVGHLGADEFGVFLTEISSAGVAELAAAKIHAAVARGLEVGDSDIPVRLCIGIALSPDQGQSAAELLRKASMALSEARTSDKESVVYSDALADSGINVLAIRNELRDAIDTSELLLYYQPKIRLATNEVSGAEALMRWQSPKRGWVGPDVFIPVAEQSDLIEPLSFWSINAALRQCSICSKKWSCLSVAVNLSARVLHNPHLVDIIVRAMNIWGTKPGNLIVEVTESAMMRDPAASLKTLNTLHDAGVTISIDDFGTGYSSLAYLKKLPIRELKIDKSFVMNMHTDAGDESIVRAIVDLSHNLGVSVVAEGVETGEALAKLRAIGCDYAQGFHIAKPMSPEVMVSWMNDTEWVVHSACPR